MDLHEILLASKIVRKNGSNSADLSDYYTKLQTDSRISEKVAEIVANAPDDFDTLKEISDWIAGHEDSAAAMNTAIAANMTAIAQKVDKVSGKGLSTNDFTDADKSKLDGLENYDDTDVKADVAEVTSRAAINGSTLGCQRKNLLKLTVAPTYNSGVSFSMSGGVLSLSGTATADKDCYFPEYFYSESESDAWIYITEKSVISCYGTLNSLMIAYYKPDVEHTFANITFKNISNNSPLVLAKGSIIIGLYVRINSGVDYTGKDLSVMLRYADITDDTYEPYKPSVAEYIANLEARINALELASQEEN